jgi:hypothetical protein
LNQAWYERCIVPALNDSSDMSTNDFTVNDIKALH